MKSCIVFLSFKTSNLPEEKSKIHKKKLNVVSCSDSFGLKLRQNFVRWIPIYNLQRMQWFRVLPRLKPSKTGLHEVATLWSQATGKQSWISHALTNHDHPPLNQRIWAQLTEERSRCASDMKLSLCERICRSRTVETINSENAFLIYLHDVSKSFLNIPVHAMYDIKEIKDGYDFTDNIWLFQFTINIIAF